MSGFPPGLSNLSATTAAVLLALLTAAFGLRVAGQFIVSRRAPTWLPPMAEWYSGVVPYPRLLAIQVAMLAAMSLVVIGLALGWPAFADPRPVLGTLLLLIAWPYALSMAIRYAVRMCAIPRLAGRAGPSRSSSTSCSRRGCSCSEATFGLCPDRRG